jgi:hypothetical protein
MSLNDSYGILSARPCEFLDDRRVVAVDAVDAAGAAGVVASTGVTK